VQGAGLKVKDAGIKVAGEKRAAACRAGFTLIEMIMVIVILGIVGLILGRIINAATQGYQSRAAMKELQSSGRLAIDYLESELRYAIPDSVRISAGGTVLEYGRTLFVGHYHQISGTVMAVDDDLSGKDFSGKWLVVYNTSPADFYAGNSSFPIAGNSSGSITCSTTIDRDSPDGRYYVCDSAVKVGRNGDGLIYYSGYDPGGVEAHGQFLCRRVQSVSFALQPGTLATEPTVSLALKLVVDSLSLTLERQVRLVNFP